MFMGLINNKILNIIHYFDIFNKNFVKIKIINYKYCINLYINYMFQISFFYIFNNWYFLF